MANNQPSSSSSNIKYLVGGIALLTITALTAFLTMTNTKEMPAKDEKKLDPMGSNERKSDISSPPTSKIASPKSLHIHQTELPKNVEKLIQKNEINHKKKEMQTETDLEKEIENKSKVEKEKETSPKEEEEEDPFKLSREKYLLASNAFKSGDYHSTIKFYSEAIDLCPKTNSLKDTLKVMYNNRAAAYEKLANYDSLILDANLGLSIDPLYPKLLSRRGNAYLEKGEYENAVRDLLVCVILAQSRGEDVSSSAAVVDKLTLSIIEKMSKKEWEKNLIRDKMLPKNYFIRFYFASFTYITLCDHLFKKVYDNKTDYENRLQDINKALIELAHDQTYMNYLTERAYLNKQCCLYEKSAKDAEEAALYFEKHDIKDEFSCEAFFLYGVYLKLRGKNSEAEKMIMMALEIKPTYNEALIEAGNLHSMSLEDCESSTQLELGMSFFKKAIELEGNEGKCDALFHRGQTLLNVKENEGCRMTMEDNKSVPDLAFQDLKDAFSLNNSFGMAALQIGICHFLKGDIAKSTHFMEKAVKLSPTLPEMLNYSGEIQSQIGEKSKANELFDKAIELDSNCPLPVANKGLAVLQEVNDSVDPSTGIPRMKDYQQKVSEALAFYNKAIEIDFQCESNYTVLGQFLFQLGDINKAIENFDKAIFYARSKASLFSACKEKVSAQNQFAALSYLQAHS